MYKECIKLIDNYKGLVNLYELAGIQNSPSYTNVKYKLNTLYYMIGYTK